MTNPKEEMMATQRSVTTKAYVTPLSFPQRLRNMSIEQNIHTRTTKGEVQLLDTIARRPEKR